MFWPNSNDNMNLKDIMTEKSFIEPRTLKGFQDFLPDQLLPRRKVIRDIEAVFEKFGFAPLDSPAMEYLETLLGAGGENSNKELFRLSSPEDEPIALRFDLTVPFARLLAQYPDRLKPPFRRYAIGPVWRADKPGPGRFREFTQMDIDAAGAASVAVDAEIIAIMCKIMTAMKIRTFTVLINNRKLIDALLESCGISDPARQKHVLRVVDKLAKVGVENIRKELGTGRIDESGDPIPGVGLEPEAIEKVLHFIAIEAPTREEVVDRLAKALPSLRWQEFRRLFKEHGISFGARQTEEDVLKILDAGNKRDIISIREELGNGRIDESGNLVPGLNLAPEIIDKIIILESLDTIASAFETGNVQTRKAEEALDEMRELAAALDALGVGEANAKFDPSLARGLDYYTGPVFEMILPQAPEFGSVMGGGRYDGLVSRFADRPIPATGMSVGLDRLMAALTYLRPREKHITSRSQVLVVSVGNVPKAETLRLATELRKARIRTETYFASRKKMQMGQQLSHADHYGIPVAVIIGEDELARGVVSVKDLRAGKEQRQDIQDREAYRQAGKTGQKTVARAEMAVHIRALLNPKATVRSREHNP